MPHDPALVDETRSWLAKAREDLRAARVDLGASPPLLADALFHCQQAAEKTAKAFLTWHRQAFRRTHSLEEIGEQCLAIDASLRAAVDRVVPLTEYAWRFRYPGEYEEPTRDEADCAIREASAFVDAVRAKLPGGVQQ